MQCSVYSSGFFFFFLFKMKMALMISTSTTRNMVDSESFQTRTVIVWSFKNAFLFFSSYTNPIMSESLIKPFRRFAAHWCSFIYSQSLCSTQLIFCLRIEKKKTHCAQKSYLVSVSRIGTAADAAAAVHDVMVNAIFKLILKHSKTLLIS